MSGADPKTMPITPEYEDGYRRTFGERKPVRGKWVYLPDGTSVPADEYKPPERAVDAPIMVDRFYENQCIVTSDEAGKPLKVDVGTRLKYQRFLRESGKTNASDYTQTWAKEEEKRAAHRRGDFNFDKKERREAIGKIAYELEKKGRK